MLDIASEDINYLEDEKYIDIVSEDKTCENTLTNFFGVLDLNGENVPCILVLSKYSLEFRSEKDDFQANTLVVNIIGIIECKVIHHPANWDSNDFSLDDPENVAYLLITYLEDILNPRSFSTIFFTGIQGQLSELHKTIMIICSQLQNDLHFKKPNLTPLKHVCKNSKEQLKIRHLSLESGIEFEQVSGQSIILDLEEITHLRIALPLKYRSYSWQLLYTTHFHGRRLQSIYSRSQKCSPLIMLISGTNGSKFGAFLPDGLQNKKDFL